VVAQMIIGVAIQHVEHHATEKLLEISLDAALRTLSE
jgi:hypothetical protein